MQEVVKMINNRDMDIDLAVFLGTDHTTLMKILDNQTALLRFPHTTLMPKSQIGDIGLRLDTNVVTIHEFRETIIIMQRSVSNEKHEQCCVKYGQISKCVWPICSQGLVYPAVLVRSSIMRLHQNSNIFLSMRSA